jgi:hypothetical protein
MEAKITCPMSLKISENTFDFSAEIPICVNYTKPKNTVKLKSSQGGILGKNNLRSSKNPNGPESLLPARQRERALKVPITIPPVEISNFDHYAREPVLFWKKDRDRR